MPAAKSTETFAVPVPALGKTSLTDAASRTPLSPDGRFPYDQSRTQPMVSITKKAGVLFLKLRPCKSIFSIGIINKIAHEFL